MRKRQRILGSKGEKRDFPGSPVIKTLPSNAGVQVRSLVGELRSHMLLAWPKKKKKIYTQVLYCFPRHARRSKAENYKTQPGQQRSVCCNTPGKAAHKERGIRKHGPGQECTWRRGH